MVHKFKKNNLKKPRAAMIFFLGFEPALVFLRFNRYLDLIALETNFVTPFSTGIEIQTKFHQILIPKLLYPVVTRFKAVNIQFQRKQSP